MKDVFEFVAVESDDFTFGFEVFEADGTGLWKLNRDLLVASSS